MSRLVYPPFCVFLSGATKFVLYNEIQAYTPGNFIHVLTPWKWNFWSFWHYDPNSSIRMRKEKITPVVIWSNQLNDIAYLANWAEFYCKYWLNPQIDIYGSSFFLFPSFMDTFRAKCYKSRKFMFMWHLKL